MRIGAVEIVLILMAMVLSQMQLSASSNGKGVVKLINETKKYWIETLVVADHTVQERFSHKARAIDYVVSLISLSEEILQDSSLNQVVHRFCAWSMENYFMKVNYDHALFLSRNIHEAAGISPLNQMCHTRYSCTLVEDSGFFTAYPIVHELLHSLGIEHDGVGNACDSSGRSGNIMAPLIQSSAFNHYWSNCTTRVLYRTVTAQRFACIRDYPFFLREDLDVIQSPGRYWSAHEQCQIAQGMPQSRLCLMKSEDQHQLCRQLWCSMYGNPYQCNRITNQALLEGSLCGSDMVCHQGECVALHVRSELSHRKVMTTQAWSSCSQTCGVGTRYRKTMCSSSDHNAEQCSGAGNLEYQTCFIQACQYSNDLREEQCDKYNRYKLQDRLNWWRPNPPEEHDPCQLTCRSVKNEQVFNTHQLVRDGTPCFYNGSTARCVQGKCINFDCHGIVNGGGCVDRCGRCDGDGSNCMWVNTTINKIVTQEGIRMMYIIPANARQVHIRFHSTSHSLNVICLDKGIPLIQSDFQIQNDTFVAIGSIIHYRNNPELAESTVEAVGPLLDALAIKVKRLKLSSIRPEVTVEVNYLRQLKWSSAHAP